jgi:hypothetical protein
LKLPTQNEIRKFLNVDGWNREEGSGHETYIKILENGNYLRTHVSRTSRKWPSDPNLWRRILREQLAVTEEEFWAAVDQRVPPCRSTALLSSQDVEAIPGWLIESLRRTVGLGNDVIASMSPEEARAAWDHFCSGP